MTLRLIGVRLGAAIEHPAILSDHLIASESEQTTSAFVPACDDAARVDADHRDLAQMFEQLRREAIGVVAALTRRFNKVVLPIPGDIDTEVAIVRKRVQEVGGSASLGVARNGHGALFQIRIPIN